MGRHIFRKTHQRISYSKPGGEVFSAVPYRRWKICPAQVLSQILPERRSPETLNRPWISEPIEIRREQLREFRFFLVSV